MTVAYQTAIFCARVLRNLARQPIWIAVMVVQPMFWLLLYSQLFRRITELPASGRHPTSTTSRRESPS